MSACEQCLAHTKRIVRLEQDLADAQAAVTTMTNAFLKASEKGKSNG